MTRPNIDEIRTIAEFATLYQWNLSFSRFPTFKGTGLATSPTELNLRCVSSEVPKLTGAPIEVTIRGHKVKQPGIHNYGGTIMLTFVETVDNTISNFIRNWREAIWESKTGIQGRVAEIEAGIILQRLNRQDEPIWQYTLTGCKIEDYDSTGGSLVETGDVLKPTITIGYDYFIDEPL